MILELKVIENYKFEHKNVIEASLLDRYYLFETSLKAFEKVKPGSVIKVDAVYDVNITIRKGKIYNILEHVKMAK